MRSLARHWQVSAEKVRIGGRGRWTAWEREDMLKVVAFAESEKTIAGLRDGSADKADDRRSRLNLPRQIRRGGARSCMSSVPR